MSNVPARSGANAEIFTQQLAKANSAAGFIAALDQSGGSTPKALLAYGVGEDQYSDDAPDWEVDDARFQSELALYRREQDAADRGLASG